MEVSETINGEGNSLALSYFNTIVIHSCHTLGKIRYADEL